MTKWREGTISDKAINLLNNLSNRNLENISSCFTKNVYIVISSNAEMLLNPQMHC